MIRAVLVVSTLLVVGQAQSPPKSEVQRVRVSNKAAEKNLEHAKGPHYPDEAKKKGIEGTVKLKALISKDGLIRQLTVLSGPEELREAAVKAVTEWRYKPTYFEGRPVEVETTITVNFKLHS